MNYLRPAPSFASALQRHPSLAANWQYSHDVLLRLRACVQDLNLSGLFTVGVAGSLGRMEACPLSDVDYIILANDDMDMPDVSQLRKAVAEVGLSGPKSDGVFSSAITLSALLQGAGEMTEDLALLARRILLLIESQPILNESNFYLAQMAVFDRYAGQVAQEPSKHLVFLMNDLIRYFRSVCVNYESTFWRENEKWPLRNLKLRHSRVLMYAGLLMLIGASSKESPGTRLSYIRDRLYLTPLERLEAVYAEAADDNFQRVATLYDCFLQQVSDEATRARLRELPYEKRFEEPAFLRLRANAEAFVGELSRFLWSRRGTWSDRFFEYLFF